LHVFCVSLHKLHVNKLL